MPTHCDDAIMIGKRFCRVYRPHVFSVCSTLFQREKKKTDITIRHIIQSNYSRMQSKQPDQNSEQMKSNTITTMKNVYYLSLSISLLSMYPEGHQAWCIVKNLNFRSSWPLLLSAKITVVQHHAWFMQPWGLNPRLHACWPSTLPTELLSYTSRPNFFFFLVTKPVNKVIKPTRQLAYINQWH